MPDPPGVSHSQFISEVSKNWYEKDSTGANIRVATGAIIWSNAFFRKNFQKN